MAKKSKSEKESDGLLIQIFTRQEEMYKMLHALHKVVYEGNGKPSLLSRMDATETEARGWKDVCKKVDSMLLKMAGIAGGLSVATFFASFIFR